VSTRRLIALALVCGLAILVAGTIQLLVLAGDDDRDGGGLSDLGVGAVVDGVTVGALDARRDGPTLVLSVSFADADEPASELAVGWALFAPDADLVPRAALPPDARPCPDTVAADEVRCDVAFDLGDDPRSGTYLAGWRGGHTWRVPVSRG